METGLKRLWSRKKSWGTADQPARPRKSSLSNGNSTQSPSANPSGRNGRPSMTSIRQKLDRPFSQDKMDRSQDVTAANTSGEIQRTKSGHRIQPMLVGISRPDTAQDRPDTAGSLQAAVQKAADSVNRRPSDVSTIHPPQPTSPTSYRAPSRHVDIFSVTGSVKSHSSRWNEDIAERNLDAYRQELEKTPYVYDPSSKYQEEVAIRNAVLPYTSRPSADSVRPSIDLNRTDSVANRSVRDAAVSRTASKQSHSPSDNLTVANSNPRQEPVSHHVRSLSQRSRDGGGLPSHPREVLDDSEPTKELGLNIQAPYSPSRTLSGNYNTREARMSTIAEGQPYEGRSSTNTKSTTLRDSDYSSNNAVLDSTDSSMVFVNQPTSYGAASNSDEYDIQTGTEALLGIPSSQGHAPKRTMYVGRRMVMDLTSDDSEIFSETSSAFYSQYSPVVEQARFDPVQKIQPSQVHTEERRGSKASAQVLDLIPTRQHLGHAEFRRDIDVRSKPDVRIEPDPEPTSASMPGPAPVPTRAAVPVIRVPSTEKRTANPSGFSPVRTAAPSSPHNTNASEPMTMTARAAAALEAGKAAARDGQSPVALKRDNDTPTVKERVASFESNSERGSSPSASAADTTSAAAPRTTSPRVQASAPAQVSPPAQTSPPVQASLPAPAGPSIRVSPPSRTELQGASSSEPPAQPPTAKAAKIPTTSPTMKSVRNPTIHTSPEEITATDYVHPSSAFGVKARDFAITPRAASPPPTTEKSTALKVSSQLAAPKAKGAEPKPKPKKPRAKTNTPARTKPKDTGFDEEAFARKRAEARAAMEKLQRSLSEDFLTLPDRPSIKGKERLVESQPVTPLPSLMVPPESKAAPSNAGSMVSASKADVERPPPSSFRTSREMQQRSSREMSQRSSREMSQRSSREMQQRLSRETQQRSSLASTTRSLSSGSRSSRRAPAPSLLKNVEPATNPIDQNILSPQLLQALQLSANPPKSPGEISLSSFPVPSSSRPPSQPDVILPTLHSHTNSFASAIKRRSSTKSQGSTASAYSIPLHMVPGRTSSVRDPVPEEVDPMWA